MTNLDGPRSTRQGPAQVDNNKPLGALLEYALKGPLKHDPMGMYVVCQNGKVNFDVVQKSSGVVVASAALQETADRAAASLNACAIVPRMQNMEDELYYALMYLNKFIWREGYARAFSPISHAEAVLKTFEEQNPDKSIDPSTL